MEPPKRKGGNRPVYRQAAWAFIRRERRFTTADLCEATGMHWRSACHLVSLLVEEGAVQAAGKVNLGATGAHVYYEIGERYGGTPRLIDAVAFWQRQAWQAMRIYREFTPSDLLRTITPEGVIGARSVKAYCELLAACGLIRKQGRAGRNGNPGSESVYIIVQHGSPEPPPLDELKALAAEAV